MRLLALDLSAKTGYAVIDYDTDKWPVKDPKNLELVAYGTIKLDRPIAAYSRYPYSHIVAADYMAYLVREKIETFQPDCIVIEEVQLSRGSRIAQKWLGILHGAVLTELEFDFGSELVVTVDPGSWRSACGLKLTKEDKKNNKAIRDGKDKKSLGIKGKVTTKHLSVRFANETFDLNLLMKDNDISDAISLGVGYCLGAKLSDGTN